MPGKRKKKSAAALDPNPVKTRNKGGAKRKLPVTLPLRRDMCPPPAAQNCCRAACRPAASSAAILECSRRTKTAVR